MKKLYALAAVACMALAANAQAPLYITGGTLSDDAPFSNGNWNPVEPNQFTFEDGVYKFHQDGLTMFKISTSFGDWDTFNEGALGCGEAGYGKENGAVVALMPWGENTVCPWAGDYDIEVAADLSTIKLYTTTPEPADKFTAVYLRGGMNEWGTDEAWKMATTDGEVYTFTCAEGQVIPAGESFKFADATWGVINLGVEDGSEVILDVESTLAGGSNPANIALEEEFDGVVYLNVTLPMVLMSNDKNTANPWATDAVKTIAVENAAPVYFNLQGVQVSEPANGLYIVVRNGEAVKVIK